MFDILQNDSTTEDSCSWEWTIEDTIQFNFRSHKQNTIKAEFLQIA